MPTAPSTLDAGVTLYVAPTTGYRRLIMTLLIVVAVLAVLVFGAAILLVVILAQASGAAAFIVAAIFFPLLLLLFALIGLNAWLQWGLTFAVTTTGLTLCPPYRRARFIPWPEVAAVEASTSTFMRGAVVAVLSDGTRLTASLTNASAAFAHPQPPPHLGPYDGSPTPLRAARDGLLRFRAGEFAGPED